jgi:hypothetical protein
MIRTIDRSACFAVPAALAALLLAALPGFANAQTERPAKEAPKDKPATAAAKPANLPKAETVLDQYVEATGGREAQEKIKNRVTKGTFEITGAGITAEMTVYAARPNKSYFVLESPALGKIERGTVDDIAWEMSLTGGPSLKEGAEKADLLREATFDKFINWQKLYAKAECAGEETVDGQPSYKVVLTLKDGKPQTYWFDKSSHLITKVTMNVQTAMGEIPVESHLSDYRKVGDILIPHKIRTVLLGQERVTTVKSVDQNVDLPADRFDPPKEVQELVKKAKTTTQKSNEP